ncbi:pectinesterase 2-like [Primulina huaijiensis]|uniref:pectinesterase 2-like n=1 Tax=Primulina huaijiensis TaxID=1492673 RepID=UPI003CC75329
MAPKSQITNFFVFLFFTQVISIHPNSTIKSWCSRTPYPQPCEYLFSHKYPNKSIKSKSDFFKLSKELALDRCMAAQDNLKSLGPKCRNKREKTAWADCVELYHSTIRKLNQTIDPNVKCSSDDVQTWLSTALTNVDTCRTGFVELGVTDYVLPLISNNVSMLLSNTLALNNVGGGFQKPSYKKGFPGWMKPGDRKLLQASNPQANVVVAQDGSGDYKTVGEAISAAGNWPGSGRYVIYVKQGTYNENVNIGNGLENIMLYGDGIGQTIITGSRSVGGGSTTFNSPTVAVIGAGFIARGITVRNTAGAKKHQAVALRSGSDLSVFYECSFEGYQDTLYVHSERQFYKECNVYGTVDFIFGNSAVVFQNCNLYPRYPPNRINTITAQARSDPNQNTGMSIQKCQVTAASDLKPVQSSVQTYLGRPWQQYSRTVFMETFLDSLIDPSGWLPWDGNFALDTLYYGEYANTGPGSSTANRVKWGGYHVITSATLASQFTVGSFIAGNSWLPGTGVPFTSGL